MQEVVREKQQF